MIINEELIVDINLPISWISVRLRDCQVEGDVTIPIILSVSIRVKRQSPTKASTEAKTEFTTIQGIAKSELVNK